MADIKRTYLDILKKNINACYDSQLEKMKQVAQMYVECMNNGGVVQLFGVKHGIELVNELNYRSGGIALYHKIALSDLVTHGLCNKEDLYKTFKAYDDISYIEKFLTIYKYDPRDLYTIISENGNEPLTIEITKRVKERGHKIVAVINNKSYKNNGGTLLEYADIYLDMNGKENDTTLNIGGYDFAQTITNVTDTMAQMLTAEVYDCFIKTTGKAPVLLSTNIAGADAHNDALTEGYDGRVWTI